MLLDTPTLTISHNASTGVLWVHWIGNHDATSVRQGCAQLLAHASRTNSHKLLNDSSEAFGEWWPASEWIGREFIPQLAAAGVQAIAWINSMDWPSRYGVASTLQHVQHMRVQLFDFDQQEKARQWLLAFQA
ncbi:SpoIIAA family protein [Hymenobacter rigui]|uniref:STAS/SEC14 domain-containing protein n=1 Tax=Hymenobacter rigui TaxID=334424 RepID=A0A428KKY2_9BACT|nr:STAS/SEC14 domain-containing protein [Hymenobacter rigui]RSK47116.1 STAS/SEC14 domain-containing protein [Hymenobacter rigui]